MELKPKEEMFVNEFLKDFNITQAYIRTYGKSDKAKTAGNNLYNTPRVKNAIEVELAKIHARTGINSQRVMNELAKIAFANIGDILDNDGNLKPGLSMEDLSSICGLRIKVDKRGSIEKEYKFCDKMKALELLGKNLNLFADTHKIEGNIPIVIQDNIQ